MPWIQLPIFRATLSKVGEKRKRKKKKKRKEKKGKFQVFDLAQREFLFGFCFPLLHHHHTQINTITDGNYDILISSTSCFVTNTSLTSFGFRRRWSFEMVVTIHIVCLIFCYIQYSVGLKPVRLCDSVECNSFSVISTQQPPPSLPQKTTTNKSNNKQTNQPTTN